MAYGHPGPRECIESHPDRPPVPIRSSPRQPPAALEHNAIEVDIRMLTFDRSVTWWNGENRTLIPPILPKYWQAFEFTGFRFVLNYQQYTVELILLPRHKFSRIGLLKLALPSVFLSSKV